MAAVLACGPGAALSHRSAAAALDLLPYASATIHVVQRALEDVITRCNGHHGVGTLASLVDAEPQLTRSDLEGLILEATRARGLTLLTDHPVHLRHGGEKTVDFYVPEARLVIEADSWAHHRSRASFEADRMRDLELMADGHRIARVTSRGAREAMDLLAGLLR